MKNLHEYNVTEMTLESQKETSGGFAWLVFWAAVGVGLLVSYLLD